ncbi:hypothetical protein K030075H31_42690 [Blautia producta]
MQITCTPTGSIITFTRSRLMTWMGRRFKGCFEWSLGTGKVPLNIANYRMKWSKNGVNLMFLWSK